MINYILTVLLQIITGLVVFEIWGFRCSDIGFVRFLVGWVLLVGSIVIIERVFG